MELPRSPTNTSDPADLAAGVSAALGSPAGLPPLRSVASSGSDIIGALSPVGSPGTLSPEPPRYTPQPLVSSAAPPAMTLPRSPGERLPASPRGAGWAGWASDPHAPPVDPPAAGKPLTRAQIAAANAVARRRALSHDEEADESYDLLSGALNLLSGIFGRNAKGGVRGGVRGAAAAAADPGASSDAGSAAAAKAGILASMPRSGSAPSLGVVKAASSSGADDELAAAPGTGKTVLSGGEDGSVHVWRMGTASLEGVLAAHNAPVRAVASLSGGRAVSAGDDASLGVWHVKSRTCLARLEGHLGAVLACTGVPDGRVVSGGADCTVCVWDVAAAAVLRTMEGHEAPVAALVYLPVGGVGPGTRVASGSHDATVRIWDCDTGRCERVLRGHAGPVTCLAALGDSRLASGGADAAPRIWSRRADGEWALERTLAAGLGSVTSLATLAPERLAVASSDGDVRLFRVLDGSVAAVIKAGVEGGVPALVSLRDGRLVTASADVVVVWRELASEDGPQLELRGHARAVTCLAVAAATSNAAPPPEKGRLCSFDRIC